MGSNAFTTLNQGFGGSIMDETSITYPSSPVDRRRARVNIAGDDVDKLADVRNSQTTGTEYALATRPIPIWFDNLTFDYGEADIANSDPETTITEYTVPASTNFFLTGISCSAETVGAFRLYINTGASDLQVMQFRNSIANLNVYMSTGVPILKGTTSGATVTTIKIKAENISSSLSSRFEGTLMGFTVPIT